MKRLLAVALVGLLVVTAGCGMTSQKAEQARQNQQPTTTTASEGNPHQQLSGKTPSSEDYPAGFSKSGVEKASRAFKGHLSVLRQNSFQIIYRLNKSGGGGTRLAITNGSGPDQQWLTVMGPLTGPQRWIYRDGDQRFVRNKTGNATANISITESQFRLTDGTFDGRSLRDILSKIELSNPKLMTSKNSTYIFYAVEGYGEYNVSGGHALIYPNGRISFIYIRYDGGRIRYESFISPKITVSEPPWVANASTSG
ncbi:MAG: hypothetical protein ABEJ27_01425 [Halodesulfurarchaeum sp.]